jgi:hypothetical protein
VRLRQHVLLRRRSWACCQSALSWLWSSALMLASIGFFGWGLWAIFFLHRRFRYPSDIFDGSGGDEIKLLNGCAHPGLGELCAAPIIHDTIFASVGHPFLQMNPEPACCALDIARRSWVQAHDNAHCVATECISFFLANPEWATQLGDDGRLKPGLSAAWQWDGSVPTELMVVDWECPGGWLAQEQPHTKGHDVWGDSSPGWTKFAHESCTVKLTNATAMTMTVPRVCTPSSFCHRLMGDDYVMDRTVAAWNAVFYLVLLFMDMVSRALVLYSARRLSEPPEPRNRRSVHDFIFRDNDGNREKIFHWMFLFLWLWVPILPVYIVNRALTRTADEIVRDFFTIGAATATVGGAVVLLQAELAIHESQVWKLIQKFQGEDHSNAEETLPAYGSEAGDLRAHLWTDKNLDKLLDKFLDQKKEMDETSQRFFWVLVAQLFYSGACVGLAFTNMLNHDPSAFVFIFQSLWPLCLMCWAIIRFNRFLTQTVPFHLSLSAACPLAQRAGFIEAFRFIDMGLHIYSDGCAKCCCRGRKRPSRKDQTRRGIEDQTKRRIRISREIKLQERDKIRIKIRSEPLLGFIGSVLAASTFGLITYLLRKIDGY